MITTVRRYFLPWYTCNTGIPSFPRGKIQLFQGRLQASFKYLRRISEYGLIIYLFNVKIHRACFV
jgi:hypothetical protein